MKWLKQNTARTFRIGPFLDEDDGKTAETGLALVSSDIRLSKAGAAFAAKSEATSPVHDENGWYSVVLADSDVDTLGGFEVAAHFVGALPVDAEFMVVPANTYDSLVSGADLLTVDAVEISGDSTSADNLELQYDTTGLSGDTFPATQASVANIASGSAAISTTATNSPNGFVITTGANEGNNEDSTHALDGVYHTLEDSGNVIDCYYIFDVGGNGVPTIVDWNGYVQGKNDIFNFYAWNWTGTPAWEQVGTRDGKDDTKIKTDSFNLTTAHVGTGANIGLVHFRIYSADGELIATDRILCSYAVVAQSVGYAEGAIWVDSAGTAGSEVHVNGIASNPCPWANALVVNSALGLNKFHVANGNTVTLAATADNYTLYGDGWNLALGSQSIDDIAIIGAHITGIGTAAAANHPHLDDCFIGAVTLPPSVMRNCGVGEDSGAFTAGSAGNYIFYGCFSQVPGSGVPSLTFSGLGSATGINNRGWMGGSNYTLDSDCTISHEVLAGGEQTFVTGGADVELRGTCRSVVLTLSGAGMVQCITNTGPVTISGTATTTVNLYGHIDSLADTSSGTTVNKPSTLLEQLKIDSASASGGLVIDNLNGPAISATGTTYGVDIKATGTDGIGLLVQATGGGTDEIAAYFATTIEELMFADKYNEVSIYVPNAVLGDITGNLSGTVGSVNARSDYMLRAGEAAQQSDITGSNLTVTSDITGGDLTVVSDITGGNLAVTSDTQNVILAAAGLDSISTIEPAGLASNFREMVVQTFRRYFGKTTMTATQLKTYKEDGTTVATTQTVADDGTTQSQGEAS